MLGMRAAGEFFAKHIKKVDFLRENLAFLAYILQKIEKTQQFSENKTISQTY